MSDRTSALKLHAVSREYGGIRALSNVSLAVATGERLGVIGPNGAGKSTLFRIIAGAESLSSGSIELFGTVITKKSERLRARAGIARTFQITELFDSLTVMENLRLAAGANGESATVESSIERFSLEDICTRQVGQLGYGQQRLIELAVAFSTGAKVLLLDEPAAGLDGPDLQLIIDAVDGLPESVTVLLIEHDMDLILGLVDRVICLANGELIADRSSAEIGSDAAVREVYLGPKTPGRQLLGAKEASGEPS